jgi:hypothetical protein
VKKLLALLMMFGLLTFTAGCPDKTEKDVKKDTKKDEKKDEKKDTKDTKKDEKKDTKKDGDAAGEVELKFDKADLKVKKGESMEVKATAGKIREVTAKTDPADSKLKVTKDGDMVKVDAKDAAKGDKATVTVEGAKGKATLNVEVE